MIVFMLCVGNAYSIGSLRRTLWYLFTRHGGLVNTTIFITLMVGVAHGLVQNDFIELGNQELRLLAYRVVWIIVFCVSLLCCYYYIKLVFNFRLGLLYEQCERYGAVLVLQLMAALLCLGALSIYSLIQQVQLVNSEAQSTELSWLWHLVFTATAIAGILQRILASKHYTFLCALYIIYCMHIAWGYVDTE